jgi:hypothetical protein
VVSCALLSTGLHNMGLKPGVLAAEPGGWAPPKKPWKLPPDATLGVALLLPAANGAGAGVLDALPPAAGAAGGLGAKAGEPKPPKAGAAGGFCAGLLCCRPLPRPGPGLALPAEQHEENTAVWGSGCRQGVLLCMSCCRECAAICILLV